MLGKPCILSLFHNSFNEKVNKQCLFDTPRTVRVSEKNLVLASDSSNQQTLVLKKRFQ